MRLFEILKRPNYVFVTNCVMSDDGDAINDMVDVAREISYDTFVRQVGREALAELFPDLDWSRRPKNLTLRGDYNVRYYRSVWLGAKCVFLKHSAIEYIFVRRDQLHLLRGKTI